MVDDEHIDLVRHLISRGADDKAISRIGETPLKRAARLGKKEVARAIVTSLVHRATATRELEASMEALQLGEGEAADA